MDLNASTITISPRTRLHTALALAIVADIVQIAVFPMFIEGAASPADDILDLGMAGAMSFLLGWHWEFLPSFFGKLVPGVDFVPLWTLAVANVWRKSKRIEDEPQGQVKPQGQVIEGELAGKERQKS
jgi:hypothetical protein